MYVVCVCVCLALEDAADELRFWEVERGGYPSSQTHLPLALGVGKRGGQTQTPNQLLVWKRRKERVTTSPQTSN